MTPVSFPQVNTAFRAPADMEESQVATIPAFKGNAIGGSCDGASIVVTAWLPSRGEIQRIIGGAPIYLTVMGDGLPPHLLSTDFNTASHPA